MYEKLKKMLSHESDSTPEKIVREFDASDLDLVELLCDVLDMNLDFWIHSKALNVLALKNTEKSASKLISVLKHNHFAYREQAVKALGNWLQIHVSPDEIYSKVTTALTQLINDPSEDVREAIVESLSNDLNEDMIELFVYRYAEEYEVQSFFVQEKIEEVFQNAEIDVEKVLGRLLREVAPYIRITIADILSKLETSTAYDLLNQHLINEQNPLVREYIYHRTKRT